MINKRSVVIIDGSNLYFKLKSLGLEKGIKFNYKGWIKKLTEETTLVAIYYCVGKIRAKQNDIKARKMMADQQSFVTSPDSDLIPAIEEAQTSGKEVTYVGFKHQPSYALLKTCKRSILIDKNDIKEFKNG